MDSCSFQSAEDDWIMVASLLLSIVVLSRGTRQSTIQKQETAVPCGALNVNFIREVEATEEGNGKTAEKQERQRGTNASMYLGLGKDLGLNIPLYIHSFFSLGFWTGKHTHTHTTGYLCTVGE